MLIPCHFLYNFSFSTLPHFARWATSFFPPPSNRFLSHFISYIFPFSKFRFIIQFLQEWWRKKMLQDLDHHHHYFLFFAALNSALYWGIFFFSINLPSIFLIFPFFRLSFLFLRDVRLFILLGSCHFSQFRLCLGWRLSIYIVVFIYITGVERWWCEKVFGLAKFHLFLINVVRTRHDNAKSQSLSFMCVYVMQHHINYFYHYCYKLYIKRDDFEVFGSSYKKFKNIFTGWVSLRRARGQTRIEKEIVIFRFEWYFLRKSCLHPFMYVIEKIRIFGRFRS